MRAAVTTGTGDLNVIELQDVSRPEAEPGEVLIEVGASGINFGDIWLRRGMEGTVPRITGVDVAGTVAEVGEDVEDRAVGDRVVCYWNTEHCRTCEYCRHGETTMCRDYGGLGLTRDGGHAEYLALDAKYAVPLPDEVTFEAAAAFATAFGTAWRALVTRATLRQGEDVLVTGASGGVGHAAVQVAKAEGATVYACTSADWKAEKLRNLGADYVIDYTEVNLDDQVRELTDGRGVDVAFESVGGETYERAVRSLDRGGRLVSIGATTGDADAAMLTHVFWKQLEVIGSTGATLGEFYDAVDRLRDGVFDPVVDSVVGLEEVPDAQQKLLDREVFGKVIVSP